jgi:hypothetical protein
MPDEATASGSPDVPAPVADHVEEVADEMLEMWFLSQRHDLESKRRTTTLKQVVMSAYLRGVLDGAKSQYLDPQDLSPVIDGTDE